MPPPAPGPPPEAVSRAAHWHSRSTCHTELEVQADAFYPNGLRIAGTASGKRSLGLPLAQAVIRRPFKLGMLAMARATGTDRPTQAGTAHAGVRRLTGTGTGRLTDPLRLARRAPACGASLALALAGSRAGSVGESAESRAAASPRRRPHWQARGPTSTSQWHWQPECGRRLRLRVAGG